MSRLESGRSRLSGSPDTMISVLIISPTRFYREGLLAVLDREADIAAVAESVDVDDLFRSPMPEAPDVVLIDVGSENSLEAIKSVVGYLPTAKVIALGVPDRAREVIDCAEAGAAGYVTREDSLDALVAAVRGVVQGEMQCSASMASALLRRVTVLAAECRGERVTLGLTRRELEIIELIARGLSNKQIAHELWIELPTVKNHVHNILEKLGVHRRAEAAVRARVEGLLRLN
jgi:two-component system nitrate/nitrite response regulator NarL